MSADKPGTPICGPDTPHPLSQMQTALVREGKYGEFGTRRQVHLSGCMKVVDTFGRDTSITVEVPV